MTEDPFDGETRVFTSQFTDQSDSVEPRIFAINGPIQGATFELSRDTTRIGRRPDNEVQVPFAGVSKLHCVIERDAQGRFFITDSRSTNGTEVNGRRLKPGVRLQLTDGDTIAILDTAFFFLNPAGSATDSGIGEIRVDFDSAVQEARGALEDSDEILALKEARKRRRKRG